jgi:hypothetical protein
MYRRADALALDPLGPIGIDPIGAFSSPPGPLGLDPLSPVTATSERQHRGLDAALTPTTTSVSKRRLTR